MQTETIRIPTIDVSPIVMELEWKNTDPGWELIAILETAAGDGYELCEDEDAVTVVGLTVEQRALLREVMAEIALEFNIDISAGILGVEPGRQEAEPLANTAGEVGR